MGSTLPQTLDSRSGRTVLLRTASPDDATALIEYCQAVTLPSEFFVTEPDEFDRTEQQERESITQHRDSPGSLMLLAEMDGAVIGLLTFTCGPRRRIAHRGDFTITVHSEYRGEGIGGAMLQALIDWAEANSTLHKIGLSVLANNDRAIALYRRLGFVEEGRRIDEVQLAPGEYVDDILMYRLVNRPTE